MTASPRVDLARLARSVALRTAGVRQLAARPVTAGGGVTVEGVRVVAEGEVHHLAVAVVADPGVPLPELAEQIRDGIERAARGVVGPIDVHIVDLADSSSPLALVA